MTRKFILAAHGDGKAVCCFGPTWMHTAEKVAAVIMDQAGKLGLDVTAVVVPMELIDESTIAAFLQECWVEKGGVPAEPPQQPALFPPPDAYSRKC